MLIIYFVIINNKSQIREIETQHKIYLISHTRTLTSQLDS